MINVSTTLKNACNSDKLTYREYVVLKGTTTQIDVATEMYASAYKDTHFIGSFNMKYIKFTTSNDVQYRNKELTLYKEVNGEAFKVGNFIVTEIKDDDSNEEVSVTAYDYGLKFAQPYVTNLDYESGEVTLKDVLDEICENVGVELVNTTITNGDFIVDSNQFVAGEVYGDVISAIAFISADFATINNEDKLQFVFKTETNEIIEDYVDLEDKRDTRPITCVSIGMSQVEGENIVLKDEALIEQYGEHWLTINDVPFAYTQEKRQQLITAIFNKVKGFGYSSFKSNYSFKPYMALGDLIKFRNKDGRLINSIVLEITTKYDDVTLEAPSVTDASVEYQNPLSAIQVAKRAEIIVNKQEQTIEATTANVQLLQVQSANNTTEINNNYQEIIEKFNGYVPTNNFVTLENSVRQLQTDTYTRTEINTKLTDGSVTIVKTTSGTFDENGLTMEQSGAKTKTILDEKGVDVKDTQGGSNSVLFAGYVDEEKAQDENNKLQAYEGQSIVNTNNIIVDNYLVIGTHSRLEDYEDGTGVFYLGG